MSRIVPLQTMEKGVAGSAAIGENSVRICAKGLKQPTAALLLTADGKILTAGFVKTPVGMEAEFEICPRSVSALAAASCAKLALAGTPDMRVLSEQALCRLKNCAQKLAVAENQYIAPTPSCGTCSPEYTQMLVNTCPRQSAQAECACQTADIGRSCACAHTERMVNCGCEEQAERMASCGGTEQTEHMGSCSCGASAKPDATFIETVVNNECAGHYKCELECECECECSEIACECECECEPACDCEAVMEPKSRCCGQNQPQSGQNICVNAFPRYYPMVDWSVHELPGGNHYMRSLDPRNLTAVPHMSSDYPIAGLPSRARYIQDNAGNGYWIY